MKDCAAFSVMIASIAAAQALPISAQNTAATAQQTWHFPADMSPTFDPKFIDVQISDAKALGQWRTGFPARNAAAGSSTPLTQVTGAISIARSARLSSYMAAFSWPVDGR